MIGGAVNIKVIATNTNQATAPSEDADFKDSYCIPRKDSSIYCIKGVQDSIVDTKPNHHNIEAASFIKASRIIKEEKPFVKIIPKSFII